MRSQIKISRNQPIADGYGGYIDTFVELKTIIAEVNQTVSNVQDVTGQWVKQSGWSCDIYYSPDSFVIENDVVEFDTYTMKVNSVLNYNEGRKKKQKLIFTGNGG